MLYNYSHESSNYRRMWFYWYKYHFKTTSGIANITKFIFLIILVIQILKILKKNLCFLIGEKFNYTKGKNIQGRY